MALSGSVAEWARPGLVLVVAVALFFLNGAELVLAWLSSDIAMESLGAAATLLSLFLCFMVRQFQFQSSTPAPSGVSK